jgi:hypothetical protein
MDVLIGTAVVAIASIPMFYALAFVDMNESEHCGDGWHNGPTVHQTYRTIGIDACVYLFLIMVCWFLKKMDRWPFSMWILSVIDSLFTIVWIGITWGAFGHTTKECIETNRNYWNDLLTINILYMFGALIRAIVWIGFNLYFDADK